MNTSSLYFRIARHAIIACAGVSLFVFVFAASGAALEKTNLTTKVAQSGAPSAAVKAAPIEVPLSQFTIPASASEGRNPFFPDSTLAKVAQNSTNPAPKIAVMLTLNGTSMAGAKRFALINGRTFEAGEEGEVTLGGSRKVHVLCVSIKADGATVEVDGIRQELKLKSY